MTDLRAEVDRVVTALRQHQQPVFFLSRYGAHLRGVDEWIPQMTSIFMRDSSGRPSAPAKHMAPKALPRGAAAGEEPVNWLLRNREVQEWIQRETPRGLQPHVVFAAHDEETERLCAELGYRVMSSPIQLRRRLDSKLTLARIASEQELVPVPHIITRVSTWDDLVEKVAAADIGTDVVIQTAYGEGGDGTWFVRDAAGFDRVKHSFIGQDVRIMRRIRHHSLAIEAVATRDGVIVGPLERDIIGHEEVAIFDGSSSGLEYIPDFVDAQIRMDIVRRVERLGNVLIEEGFRGLFEVDFLLDMDSGDVFFGEMNPRFSGCGMVTNAVTAEVWGVPLYALHLLEFLDHDVNLRPDLWNSSWEASGVGSEWSNIIVRHLDARAAIDTTVPRTGTYKVNADSSLSFESPGSHWFDLPDADRVFYLAFHSPGTIRVRGDTIGLLLRRRRAQDANASFTDESRTLIRAVHSMYAPRPLTFLKRAAGSLSRRVSGLFARLRRPRRG